MFLFSVHLLFDFFILVIAADLNICLLLVTFFCVVWTLVIVINSIIFLFNYLAMFILLKTALIGRVAVREICVSRHYGGPIGGALEPLGPSQHYLIGRFKGGS